MARCSMRAKTPQSAAPEPMQLPVCFLPALLSWQELLLVQNFIDSLIAQRSLSLPSLHLSHYDLNYDSTKLPVKSIELPLSQAPEIDMYSKSAELPLPQPVEKDANPEFIELPLPQPSVPDLHTMPAELPSILTPDSHMNPQSVELPLQQPFQTEMMNSSKVPLPRPPDTDIIANSFEMLPQQLLETDTSSKSDELLMQQPTRIDVNPTSIEVPSQQPLEFYIGEAADDAEGLSLTDIKQTLLLTFGPPHSWSQRKALHARASLLHDTGKELCDDPGLVQDYLAWRMIVGLS